MAVISVVGSAGLLWVLPVMVFLALPLCVRYLRRRLAPGLALHEDRQTITLAARHRSGLRCGKRRGELFVSPNSVRFMRGRDLVASVGWPDVVSVSFDSAGRTTASTIISAILPGLRSERSAARTGVTVSTRRGTWYFEADGPLQQYQQSLPWLRQKLPEVAHRFGSERSIMDLVPHQGPAPHSHV